MAVRFHELLFLLLLFLFRFTSSTVAELLCHPFLTDVLKGFESGGVLKTEKYEFTENYYERYNSTHFKVCICTKKACLRKCCPLGQLFLNQTCYNSDIDINPKVYTEKLLLIPNYSVRNFHRVYGNTCKQKSFPLEPESYESDVYFLLYNGTLVLPYDVAFYETSQFCFENVISNLNEQISEENLRVFVCFPENPSANDEEILYPIGMIISMPFLLATFIVYSLPELRNLHGKNLMSHVASLLTAYIVLVIPQLGGKTISEAVCIGCGFLIQYSFLATFFWLNVMCFDIWSTFSGFGKFTGHNKEKENKKFILYSLYAWGCPTVISIVTVVVEYTPNLPSFLVKPDIGKTKCFFDTKMATLGYFYGPMAVIVLCDITFFALTAIKIFKVRRETKVLTGNESRRHDEVSKQRYNLYLKLFMVMGINWVMELISWVSKGPKELWYVTDVMNSLQGIFIFWIFVCTKKIKKILILRFCPHWATKEGETNTSTLKTSMSAPSGTTGDSVHMSSLGPRRPDKAARNGI